MKPDEWIGKSFNTELTLDYKIARDFEVKMGRDSFAIEAGDKLAACGHWLFPASTDVENSLNIPDKYQLFWKEGQIVIKNRPKLGDSCLVKTTIRDVSQIEATDGTAGYRIDLAQLIQSERKIAIDEQISLLLAEDIAPFEQIRRVPFEPEWTQEATKEQLDKLQLFAGSIFGHEVVDILTRTEHREKKVMRIQGPPAATLLIESFSYHFGSRSIDRISYKAHGFTTNGKVIVAGRDSDAFVTSMVLMNENRQVLFSADIRWSYNW